MLSHRLVVTYGTTETSWLSNVTDLAVARIGGQWMLFSTTHVGGGVASFAIGGAETGLHLVQGLGYPQDFTYQGDPELAILDLPDGSFLHLGQLGGAVDLGIPVDGFGNLSGFDGLFPSGQLGDRVTALGYFSSAAGDFIYSGHAGDLTLKVQRVLPDGSLQTRSTLQLPASEAIPGAGLDQLLDLTVGNQRLLVAISSGGNFISTHRIGEDGVLGAGAMHVAAQGMGYDIPAHVGTLQFGGKTFLVVGASSSSSLSVFRLGADGSLTATDYIIDELTTRFQYITGLAAVVVDGRGYVIAAGADDGVSVFTLLPDGRS